MNRSLLMTMGLIALLVFALIRHAFFDSITSAETEHGVCQMLATPQALANALAVLTANERVGAQSQIIPAADTNGHSLFFLEYVGTGNSSPGCNEHYVAEPEARP